MAVYLSFMTMPVILWAVFYVFYKRSVLSSDILKKRYIIICGLFLFLMIALRHYSVGSGDGAWYYTNWKFLSNMSLKIFYSIFGYFDVENGYLITIWTLSHVFKDSQFVFVFYGLLVAISVSRFIYKNCDDPVLGFTMFNCLGLWGFMVQGLRQGIAMSICLFAVELCKEKKLIKFILCVLLAMLFHASAIVFFALYIFKYVKMDIKGYFATIVGGIVVVMSIDRVFGLVNYVINDEYNVGDIGSSEGGLVSMMIYIIIIFAMLLFYGKDENKEENLELFFYMTLCGLVMFLMRYSVNSITQRAAYYYMFGQIVLLPKIIQNKLGKEKSIIALTAVVLCLGITVYKASYSVLVPYLFFWQV